MVEQVKKCSKLQLYISCRNLSNHLDYGGLDPFIEVYEKVNDENWDKLGTTEVVQGSLNPAFVTSFSLDYFFEENQMIKFMVYGSEDSENEATEYNLVGTCSCPIGQLVGTQGQTLALSIINESKKHSGYLIARIEENSSNNDEVVLQFQGSNIEDVSSFFSPFEPFFYLYRVLPNSEKLRIYMSEYSHGTDPLWKPFTKKIQDLCHDDFDMKLLLEIYDYKTIGDHEYIGSTEFTLQKIIENPKQKLELINPRKKSKSKYVNSGFIYIVTCTIKKIPSFFDYIQGGCQISLEVAIDFTGSNKHPSSTSSLHYIDPEGKKLNHYQKALQAVSEILLHYDSDKKVPMYGFGGKVNDVISHCFPLNRDDENPYAVGVEGMMEMYKRTFDYVGLSGPTLFADLLKKVILDVERQNVSQNNQQYTILLILTDGEIHDMEETVKWIVRGSASALSIVIVGIGNETFTKMTILDADKEPLVDLDGKKMVRDIVQFVPFRDLDNSPYRLVKEVLDEIPREIVNFFRIKNIVPNPPVQPPQFTFSQDNLF
ncbi:hypothetical protein SteCoe_4412 [Stentor coeruleus]|uniref:C2 domain-containing protein n=1 Tax=Stentor coeruleus TaxID=5963 RepID=A0A1R2CUU6_9CILI|nr:hypothetical protein SteCoe_4412 [Stentor coeruleus]